MDQAVGLVEIVQVAAVEAQADPVAVGRAVIVAHDVEGEGVRKGSALHYKQSFLESLDRCSANDSFIPAFYARFLATSDEVRVKFCNTDFDKQNQMLLQSLRLAAGATNGDPDSLREMRERAETHNRHHLDIKPHLYKYWLESVIETAEEFDPEWDELTAKSWSTILGFVVDHMVKYY